MSENHKNPRDPKCNPVQRKVSWATGSTTLLETLPGTGGFLLLRKDPKKTDKAVLEEYTVRIFVSVDMGSFNWEKPADEVWCLVDVPRGFSINNGDALVEAVDARDGGVIVHGRP